MTEAGALDQAEFCRQVESYLCRKNEGHLIRIVGPAFDLVCGWAARGVPLRIAFSGIDRCIDRYYAKGPRRRPVRIEFCDADVLDAFDEWRKAIGIPDAARPNRAVASAADESNGEPEARKHGSLASHVDRVIARLTSVRAGAAPALSDAVDDFVRELDGARATVKALRGAARQTFIDRLQAIDGRLLAMAREQADAALLDTLRTEADAELTGFRDRMPAEAFAHAHRACVDRLLRDRLRLPTVTFGG